MPKTTTNNLILADVKNNQRFWDLLQAPAVAVSPQLDILWANRAASNLAKRTGKGLKGTCHARLFEKDAPCEECPLLGAEKDVSAMNIVSAGDSAYTLEIHPLANASGFLVLHHDVSEIIRARNRFRTILDCLPNGIVLVDERFQIEYISQGFFKIFPFVKAPVNGKDFRLIVSRHSPPFPKALLDFIFLQAKPGGGVSITRLDFEIDQPAPAFFEVSCQTFENGSMPPEGKRLFLFFDRTLEVARRNIRSQIEIQAEVDKLFRDLYMRLSPGLKRLKTLSVKPKTAREVEERQRQVRQESAHLLRTLKELNRYGKKEPEGLGEIDLNHQLRKTIRAFQNAFLTHGVKVKTRFTRHIRPIYGDGEKLGEVLQTIFTKSLESVAAKLGFAPGEYLPLIEVQTRMHGETLELTVKDNGAGADVGDSDEIYLCRLITRSMGGELEARSVKGVGTKFILRLTTLPSAPPTGGERETAPQPRRSGDKRNPKRKKADAFLADVEIWILGQRDFNTEAMEKFISKAGGNPKIFENAESLFDTFRHGVSPDCIVLNVTRESELFHFLSTLKEENLLRKAVFALPEELLPIFKKKTRDMDGLKTINKPFTMEALAEAVTSRLEDIQKIS